MNKVNKKLLIASFIMMTLVLTSFVAVAKNDGDKENKGKSDKSAKQKEIKDFEKPKNANSNAVLHKKNIAEVVVGLEDAAEEEETSPGNSGNAKSKKTKKEVVEEIQQVADEEEETGEETADAIEQVESRNKFKKLLVGTDYKNLGQLRSSLAKNENQIRKLTKLAGEVTDEESRLALEEQLVTLMQERERIKTVITNNEEGFSVLGWVFKLLNGYSDEPVDNEEEEQLEDEVLEVLEDEEGDEYEDEYEEDVIQPSPEVLNQIPEAIDE